MEHLHRLSLVLPSCEVFCADCDVDLRLATADEARFVQMTDGYALDGPILVNDNGVIAVPRDFSLFQEA